MSQPIPILIRKALEHVRSKYPRVDRVTYGADGRWHFEGPGYHPVFGLGIDVGLLEDASDVACDNFALPATFVFPEDKR